MIKNIFKNKKVLIMGLGLNGGGVGVAKFFCKQGAEVLVTDKKTEEQLKESLENLKKLEENLPAGRQVKYTLGRHEEEDFLWADMIIKNPDVPSTSPYLEIARKNKIPVETDLTLFFKLSKAFVIGVTGTKGKTTTASLIYHILKQKYKNVLLAGNIGVSPLEFLPKIKKNQKVVLELSSFGLEDLKQSPQVAVITNIMPDHLNRYANMAEYIEAKKIIFKFQTKKDFLILNGDDAASKSFSKEAKAKVIFSNKGKRPNGSHGYPEKVLDSFKLFGENNLSNLAEALEVAKIMKVPEGVIVKALKSFKGVPNRQEFVKELNGVKYFNDTTATIPEAVISAIDSFSEKFPSAKLFIICGGVYKGVDYNDFAKKVREKSVGLIMLPGNGSDKMKEKLEGYKEMADVLSMQEAVEKARSLAKAGDVVVLSPGASSFNLFKNEFDRGNQFVGEVKKYE